MLKVVTVNLILILLCSTLYNCTDSLVNPASGDQLIDKNKKTSTSDPYLYLEEVEGKQALEFATTQSNKTLGKYEGSPRYMRNFKYNLDVMNDEDKLVYPTVRKGYVYDLHRTAEHIKGIYRRTTVESYKTQDPDWDTILDIDKLAKDEGKDWVWGGPNFLLPNYDKVLFKLSIGGSDAAYTREFDMKTRSFVEGGFYLPEAKSTVAWFDANSLLVATDWGPGTLTEAGYPRQVKLLKRGEELSQAKLIAEADYKETLIAPYIDYVDGKTIHFIQKYKTFWTYEYYQLEADKPIKLDLPEDARFEGLFKNYQLIQIKSPFTVDTVTYPAGSLLAKKDGKYTMLFQPNGTNSLGSVTTIKDKMLLTINTHVVDSLMVYQLQNGKFIGVEVETDPMGSLSVFDNGIDSNDFWYTFTGFHKPTSIYLSKHNEDLAGELIKQGKKRFDPSLVEVKQHFATSDDGTQVPYFIMYKKGLKIDGTNPTIMYGYGGFRVSLTPSYIGTRYETWLKDGGIWVTANIRGGGEYGPEWHKAAIREKKTNSYKDFAAIAKDLTTRNYTNSSKLGIYGGSNGGLLVGASMILYPELYKAVVCTVPLLDMQRYHLLLAGTSWMGEYGDPDTDDWNFIQKYSPYQKVKEDQSYPELFLYTSTKDDRVHPGHARKMAKKMLDYGYKPEYYENTVGGHGGATNNDQSARQQALIYSFFWDRLGR